MRAFVVTLLSLCSVTTAYATNDGDAYRSQSLANLAHGAQAHFFFERGYKFDSINQIPGIYDQYLIKPGQSMTRNGVTTHLVSQHVISETEQQIRDELALGYFPYPDNDDFPNAMEQWQDGKMGSIDKSKAFCEVGTVSEITGPGPLGLGSFPSDPFPSVTVDYIEFTHDKNVFVAEIGLSNEAKNIAFSASCVIPPSQSDFTVGQFEDIFGNRILFKGARFAATGHPASTPQSLNGLKVQVLRKIDRPRSSQSRMTLQDGRVIDGMQNFDQSKSYCVVNKVNGKRLSVLKPSDVAGQVSESTSAQIDINEDSPTDLFVNVQRSSRSPILQMTTKNGGGFSLTCTSNNGARIPTVDDLNAITGSYIRFSK